jgi:hypothetical protein
MSCTCNVILLFNETLTISIIVFNERGWDIMNATERWGPGSSAGDRGHAGDRGQVLYFATMRLI